MSKEELVEKTDKNLKIQECKDEIKKYFLERLDAETDDNSSYAFFEQKVYTIMGSKEVYDIIEKYGCTRNDVGIYSNYYEDLATKKFEAIKRIQECKDEIKKYFLERLDAETDDNSSYVFVEQKVYNIMSSQEVADIIEKHGCTRNDISIYSNYYFDLATKKFEAIKRDGEFKEVGKTTTIDIPAFLDEVEKNVRKYVHDNIGSATNDRDFIYLLINLYSLRYINHNLLEYVSQYLYDSKPHEKVLPYMVYVDTMQERCKDLYDKCK